MPETTEEIIEHIFARFAEKGHLAYGEFVTEQQHALQSATFAERDGQPEAMVVACLLHDYGHLCHNLGEHIADEGVDAKHEEIGARQLKKWFGPEIVEPGRLHVAAKRYLCTVDPAYRAGLSPASEQSFVLQGGPMSPEEVAAFEAEPYFKDAVTLRRYDDLGKEPEMETPPLEHFRGMMHNLLANRN
ncbi:MAG: HD domain-containing protein [Candidatus Hydrogenedens sp.]|nr:HD domain-containing protein [Candidatus Hydrogenedens sp.]